MIIIRLAFRKGTRVIRFMILITGANRGYYHASSRMTYDLRRNHEVLDVFEWSNCLMVTNQPNQVDFSGMVTGIA